MKRPEIPPRDMDKKTTAKLIDIMKDTEINKKLNDIDKDYPYWEKFKYKVKGLEYDAETLWYYNSFTRSKTLAEIKVSDLSGFDFRYNTPSSILKLLHHFDLNLGGVLEGSSIIPAEDKSRYLISSIMEEAIASSQLEGAATTREIAKDMLRTNRKPRNISEKMILNNYQTIKRVLEIKEEKISKELILELHSLISSGTLKSKRNEGKFRIDKDVNVVDDISGEIFYTPPNPELIERLMDDFCLFANTEDDDANFLHPIIKGIILHFLIGYIHPFVEGNGRTARAIFYWYLIKKGYWLVEYMSISKIIIKAPAQYARAYLYTKYDSNDLTYFLDYNLKCMNLALHNLQTYIQSKILEKKSLIHLITNENVNERQAELLRRLIIDSQKSFTIKEVENMFGVVYQTARTDLIGLAKNGYLLEKKFGKKLIYLKSVDFEKKAGKYSSALRK